MLDRPSTRCCDSPTEQNGAEVLTEPRDLRLGERPGVLPDDYVVDV